MGFPPVILTIGTFDMLHSGHINLFRRIKEISSESHLVVAVNSDEFAARFKRKPIMPYEERVAVLSALEDVDEVVQNHEDEYAQYVISKTNATHLVHGDDWVGEPYLKQLHISQEWLDFNGVQLFYLPYTQNISTTQLYENIRTNANNQG